MILEIKDQKLGMKSSLRQRINFPVIFNLIFVPAVIIGTFSIEFGLVPQSQLGFVCQDPSLSFPYYDRETMSIATTLGGCYIFPILLIAGIELIREGTYKNIKGSTVWLFYKEVVTNAWFVTFIVETAKLIFAEHRPYFLEACLPDNNFNCTPGTYVEDYTCTNQASNHNFITRASRSFPSSHAAVGTFCSLFWMYIIQTRLPSAVTGQIFKLFLKSLCLGWSLLCTLTRITDRRHHWWDVLCGAIIGLLGAIYCLLIFHPKVRKYLDELDGPPIPPIVSIKKSYLSTESIQVEGCSFI